MASQESQALKGPSIAAALAAAVAFFIPGGQAASLAFMTTFATTYALQGLSMREARKRSLQDVSERKTNIRSAQSPHRIVFGNALCGGTVTYVQVTGAEKELMHGILAIAGHEVHSFGPVWFDDVRTVRNESTGAVTSGGELAGLISIWPHVGTTTQAADANLIAASAGQWTSAHQGKGIAYAYIRRTFDQDKNYVLTDARLLVRGAKYYDPRTGLTALTANPAIVLRGYLTAPYGIAASSTRLDDTSIAAAADICDEWVDTGITGVTATVGYATGFFTLASIDSRLGIGDRLTLNTGSVPGGFTAGGTYYLVRIDGQTVGLAASYQDAIDGTTIAPTGGTPATVTLNSIHQRRYTVHGSVTLDQQPKDIVEDLLESMAGNIVRIGGKIYVHAGAYTAPTITLTERDTRGPSSIQPRVARHDLVNSIAGSFVDVGRLWTQSDYPPVADAAYVPDDGGATIQRRLDFPFVTDALRAQRLAKIALRRSRARKLTLRCKLSALRLAGFATVSVTYPQLGLDAAVFRIMRLDITGDDGGLGVDLSLREEATTDYEWSAGDATAPVPTIPLDIPTLATAVVAPPTITVSSGNDELLAAADGSIISRMRIDWGAAAEPSLVGYEIQYRRAGDSAYQSINASRDQNTTWAAPVEDGLAYDVRVRSVAAPGTRRSAWASTTHTVVGKTAAPTGPTSLAVVAALGGYDIAWSACPDADYATSQLWESTSNDRTAATLVADMTGNRFARAGLPGSVTRWYWVRHIDRSGNVSDWFPGGAGAGISGVTISPSGGGIPTVTDASAITAGTGSPPPGGDDYWAVYDNATGKIWRWSLVLGAYTKAADGGDITAGSIAADKIAVANLAAINADLGSITAGAIDIGGGKFSVASDGTTIIRNATTGARLEVRNNVIKVYDASGTLRVKLGDLSA